MRGFDGAVVKDDDFVDAEDCEGAGEGAGEGGFEVVCLCAVGLTLAVKSSM